jgi:hypothetical protein
MKEILSSVSPKLKPIQRTAVLTNPMTADEISSFELKRIVLDERVDKILLSQPDAAKVAEPLASQESNNSLSRIKDKKKMELNLTHLLMSLGGR